MTRSTIVDNSGVELAGPDTPGLQQAEANEGKLVVQRESGQQGRVLMGATVGRVTPSQAGILDNRRLPVTEDMVRRAREASGGLDAGLVRTMLEAALQG